MCRSVPDEGWISQKYSFDEGMEQEYSESTLKIPLTEFNAEKVCVCVYSCNCIVVMVCVCLFMV